MSDDKWNTYVFKDPWALDDSRRPRPLMPRPEPKKPVLTIEIYEDLNRNSRTAPECQFPEDNRVVIHTYPNEQEIAPELFGTTLPIILAHELGHAIGFRYRPTAHRGFLDDCEKMGWYANRVSPHIYPMEIEAWEYAEEMMKFRYTKSAALRTYDWAKAITDGKPLPGNYRDLEFMDWISKK
jgi:hypothetical protein